MRVGYLTGAFPRPTDTWIQREISALRSHGVEIETFAVRQPAELPIDAEQENHATRTTYLVPKAKSAALLTSHLGQAIGSPRAYLRAARLAMTTKRPGLKGSIYQVAYFAEAAVLAAELKKRNIEHLHNHFGDSSCTVAMLASELSGVPFSFTLHGPGIFFEPITWRIDEKLRRSVFCACISFFCRSQAAIFADPEELDKLHIIHCGVPAASLGLRHHVAGSEQLLFVARLEELKGIGDLLRAIATLRNTHPDLRLTVIGDGPGRKRFERLTHELGLDHSVEFTGYISPAEVSKALSNTDVLVSPSYAEGVPVSLMEALGSGVPVVATQVGGVSELVEDDVNGFIIRPGDTEQLADRLHRLLADPELRRRFGQAGKAKVARDFDSNNEAARLKQLFENQLAGIASPTRPKLPTGSEQKD